jgi:hypothetical protein
MDDRVDQPNGKPIKSLPALAAAYRDFVADLKAAHMASGKHGVR